MSTFYRDFLEQAQRNPAAPAIAHASAAQPTTSYGDLRVLAERYATHIAACTPRGSPVLLFANKVAESVACSLGCLASGRPFVWLHKRLRGPQIGDVISASRAQAMIIDASGLSSLRNALHVDRRLSDVRWLALSDTTPLGEPAALAQAIRRMPESLRIDTLDAPDRRTTLDGLSGDQMGCCLFTSGSTGRQRGVMVAESDLTARARSEAEWYSLSERDRLMSILPLSFDVGLNQLMSGLVAGACIVIQDSWLPKDLIDTLTREQITGISGVPAVWRDLLGAGFNLAGPGGRSLRYITISGGSLSTAEQQHLLSAAPGVRVFKTYGQTETFRSTSLRPDEFAWSNVLDRAAPPKGGAEYEFARSNVLDRAAPPKGGAECEFTGKEASVGRAYLGTRVMVVRDDGTLCSPGEPGEVVHAGDGTMLGYLDAPSPDDKVRDLPAQLGGGRGVFTGDDGYLDRDGYLYLKGRRDSMVKIAGHRIYPEEAAMQLHALDDVHEAEVVAVSDANGDPTLVGFVVLAPGVASTPEGVRRAAGERLPSHMVPAQILLLQAIPRLANGKPDRPTLTMLYSDDRAAST